jgi:hypothetical protein
LKPQSDSIFPCNVDKSVNQSDKSYRSWMFIPDLPEVTLPLQTELSPSQSLLDLKLPNWVPQLSIHETELNIWCLLKLKSTDVYS